MIRDKIFVKIAIVFGIGVLLFGSIIFFVNRNPKNEKHLNKVHKSELQRGFIYTIRLNSQL